VSPEPSVVVGLLAAAPHELAPGVSMRPLFGAGAMLNLLEFEPGAAVPAHEHPHEQLGYVIEGELRLTIAGEEHVLGPGDGYRIAGGTEHAARTDGRCLVLDVFQPVREDYRARVAGSP
jgi:quercetin dioxygenase-like cupin family protein